MAQNGMTAPLADRIRAVLALAEKAEPGPWCTQIDPEEWSTADEIRSEELENEFGFGVNRSPVEPNVMIAWTLGQEEAEFIASAPEMAALLREALEMLDRK